MIFVRHADDYVAGFQPREDAERFLGEPKERLGQSGLELHPGKIRLLEFRKYAEADRRKRGEGRPETFDFLGMTHFCRRTSFRVRCQVDFQREMVRAQLSLDLEARKSH